MKRDAEKRRFGAYLRKLRKKRNLSQEDIAGIVNVRQTGISRYELGISYPDIQIGMRLAQVFGTTVEDLLSGRVNPDYRRSGLLDVEISQKRMSKEEFEESVQLARLVWNMLTKPTRGERKRHRMALKKILTLYGEIIQTNYRDGRILKTLTEKVRSPSSQTEN